MIPAMFQPAMKIDRVDPEPGERRFRLQATGGGAWANMLGMGSQSTLSVDPDGFRLKKTTFGVEVTTYIPRSQIASTVHIVAKPVELLVLGLITLLAVVGIVFLVIYFLSRRRVVIGVVSTGGTVEAVRLKATDYDLEDIHKGMRILDALIGGEAAPGEPLAPPPPPEPRRARGGHAAEAGETLAVGCPSCGTKLTVPGAAAGRKVRCTSCREVVRVPAAAE